MKYNCRHKVSATPYDTLSKNVGGYGRKVRGITLSPDCPVEFIRTEHLARPRDFTPAPKEIASRKAGVEASYVLPGGSSYTEQPIHGRSYSKFNMENRVSSVYMCHTHKVVTKLCPSRIGS